MAMSLFLVVTLIVVVAAGISLLMVPASVIFLSWRTVLWVRNPDERDWLSYSIKIGSVALASAIAVLVLSVLFLDFAWWDAP
ncbi:hypothetical protein [Chelativorans salis]|uniref:Uncharacterized protein n=1 Tax=Chelativorans salis TaxID=2978478 RepID=A0ABT2LYA3_9HYPH|nr:hypothetical protein [Chelativorans sp. EGI FJ00035]MCT7378184.1 hypothetical protein [Chelativorans sp. EGI FJ00035]